MIDFTKSKQYTLSIRLSTDGFSFSIYNPINDNSQSLFEKEVDTSLSLTANLKNVFREKGEGESAVFLLSGGGSAGVEATCRWGNMMGRGTDVHGIQLRLYSR